MPETSQDADHCPSCGALATETGDDELRICSACGFEFEPAVPLSSHTEDADQSASSSSFVQRDVKSRRRAADRVEAVVSLEAASAVKEGAARRSDEEVVSDDGRKKVVRRRKKRKRPKAGPLLFLCAWTVVVLTVVIFVRRALDDEDPVVDDPKELEVLRLQVKKQKMREFLSKNFNACHTTLKDFLTAESTLARTQFVRNSGGLANAMKNYYLTELPWTLPRDGRLVVRKTELFMHEQYTTIEAVYGVEGGETAQRDREVAFVTEDGNWVIDWQALVRHSSQPWQIFIDEIGGTSHGVFRVYMRNTRGTLQNEKGIVLKFYPPPSDHRDDSKMWQLGSPPVRVSRDTENGRRIQWILDRAMRERELGESSFGANDPKDLHRVRVELAWAGEDGERHIELRAVLANNWYGSGFEEDFAAPAEEGGEKAGAPDEEAPVPAPQGEEKPEEGKKTKESEAGSEEPPREAGPEAGAKGAAGRAQLSIALN